MKKIPGLLLLVCFPCFLQAQEIPARMGDETMINDYTGILSAQQKDELEVFVHQARITHGIEGVFILTNDKVKNQASEFAGKVAASWKLSENSVLIFADIHHANYGFHAGKNVSSYFPSWVLEKIKNNHLKSNFRDKKYFEGIKESLSTVVGLKTGNISQDDLRKEEGGNGLLILFLSLPFFIIVFPILQYRAMKKDHFSTRPVDFVSSVLVMNYFGTRGKNSFDNFSKGQGAFTLRDTNRPIGGGGVSGSW